ncbi:preprotein translocase subunit YajC [Marinobacterium sp. D7]|uniref:Sec translocon accessory complex subunit YajC n=1 Tax=Marinobacterium lacunae TaxID=1232683 RepID=A0A081G1E3_9GAMM|nr:MULTISPECIES: preprotein translocase subunit YajC [Marinobacterium]KEA64598.1 Preprotein translocase subunit YajC [Marinobacterium lacunae]MBR9885357.1 preprotein translocase subunit YajC [Oceanospirillales bacterium]MBV1786769.1 preprotein translocase subunit YajC [Marinobacterium ramblicola]
MSFLIATAQAAEGAPAAGQMDPGFFNIIFLVGFGLIFYFFMWRPQAKRAKAHKALIGGLAKGDEVITAGGIIGKVTRLNEEYVVLEVAEGTEMKFQKAHVAAELPKGTIKSI